MLKTLIASAAIFTAGAGGAYAQSTYVVGASPAAACYQHARADRGDRQALTDCNAALETGTLTPRIRARTHVNRAVIYIHMNQPDAALADLRAAEALRFHAPEVYQNYSVVYLRLNRPQEAVEAATRALEGGITERHYAFFNRAVAHEALNNVQAAHADYRAAAEFAPGWSLPLRELERFSVHGS